MPTLKDIQEEMNKKFDEIRKKPPTYEELITFIESETTLAFQAGEKSKEDMVLKEIEEMRKTTSEKDSDIVWGEKLQHNQALSSLKEKIISDNQK